MYRVQSNPSDPGEGVLSIQPNHPRMIEVEAETPSLTRSRRAEDPASELQQPTRKFYDNKYKGCEFTSL
ncbi:hypothetical protein JTE90_008861 [Oedothorax gibbosus]|uniref:Uncharacterized protein n=1 Tax=Oedothorax gibbosus TaxID=931172 RepID=A0AAV6TVS9_9ARAC|nr:hypothetical protein JTE90_008861 [Oedothorax gibbosus]